LASFVQTLENRGRLAIAGVFSHFAGLGCHDEDGMRQQFEMFCNSIDAVPALRGVRRHICNSLGAMMLPDACLDAVRIGGGLYGFDPRRKPSGELAAMATGTERLPASIAPGSLLPALELKANVVGLREARVGDRVGYGGSFTCQRPTRLALLPLGYGDGLSRELWRGAEVLVRGRRAPIVGEISMNQTVVDVTDLPQVVFGEEVVLIGAMGDQQIWAEERVPAGGSAYEVTSLLQSRLPRVYGLPGTRDTERRVRRDVESLRGRSDHRAAPRSSSSD
jgi:alanine racemase